VYHLPQNLSDKTSVTFDDFQASDATVRVPLARGLVGSADASLSSGALLLNGKTRGGEVAVAGFADDDYLIQAMADLNSGATADIWARYTDPNNAYRVRLTSTGIALSKSVKGFSSTIASGSFLPSGAQAVKIKLSGTSIKVWVGGTQYINTTDGAFSAGGVAFGGEQAKFDNVKIGYDTECDQCGSTKADDDIDDAGDDLVVNEDFGGTGKSIAYDDAGNLVDDSTLEYQPGRAGR